MKTTDGDDNRARGNRRQSGSCHRNACQLKNNGNASTQPLSGRRLALFLLAMLGVTSVVGCLGTDNSKLVGRWEGRSGTSPVDDGSDSETNEPTKTANPQFTTTLIFRSDDRFSMELVGSNGQIRRTQGTWQIDQATGRRWEVTLKQDESQASVRLRIAFDEQGFTARQVDGDDRIDSIHYRRVSE